MSTKKEGTQYGNLKVLNYLGNQRYECMCLKCGKTYTIHYNNIGITKCCKDCYLESVKKERLKPGQTVDSFLGCIKGESLYPKYPPGKTMDDKLLLTEKEKIVVELREQGLSYREIGEKIGGKVASVEGIYKRALLKLAGITGQEDYLKINNRDDLMSKMDLALLTEKERKVVELRADGLSYGQISKIIGSSEQCAEQRFNRAMLKLDKVSHKY